MLKETPAQDPSMSTIVSGIANLAANGDIRETIARLDGIPLVVAALRKGVANTKSQALRAISNLAIKYARGGEWERKEREFKKKGGRGGG